MSPIVEYITPNQLDNNYYVRLLHHCLILLVGIGCLCVIGHVCKITIFHMTVTLAMYGSLSTQNICSKT